jgi:hypothetical protein
VFLQIGKRDELWSQDGEHSHDDTLSMSESGYDNMHGECQHIVNNEMG